ncbi:DUF3310 domain-containing protein [Virgibacillus oceani]
MKPPSVEEVMNMGKDNVNHPPHYQGKFEVIEIIEQLTKGMEGQKAYCLGNVVKYLFRHEKKNGVEDLEKGLWYLKRAIELEGKK